MSLRTREGETGIRLGQEGQLGWTTWLGARRSPTDADDLILTPERRQPAEPVAAMAA